MSTALAIVIAAGVCGCGSSDEAQRVGGNPDVASSVPAPAHVAVPAAVPAPATEPADAPTVASARSTVVPGEPRAVPASTTSAVPRKSAPAPFRLVGTSISDHRAFAFLKETDQSLVTVREGDQVDGYTVAAIAPDRVMLRSGDDAEQVLVLASASGPAPASPSAADPAKPAITGKITAGINTDQSIPEHVTWGPTGNLPAGMKQMGH